MDANAVDYQFLRKRWKSRICWWHCTTDGREHESPAKSVGDAIASFYIAWTK
ncbi:hypothetical protein J0895_13165 [Phormidium pseudopriestleyi FRX01]|uniref:Uncharacterized protein n=1 Tax=Phormidium pseudopriestleyi FRX01 TaxID=1759528 RepID=A0ABS3FSH6_9CYAN|nr:hypothetical protein [Phormidium pseudopriestleyi]MBO0350045.1 hypothetical protein [Phormidium pseudopriestleyi FRX01]